MVELTNHIGQPSEGGFPGYASVYGGLFKSMSEFWRETMIEAETSTMYTGEELAVLMKLYNPALPLSTENFYDGILIDIVKCQHPEAIVEESGLITNYACRLFPKTELVGDYIKGRTNEGVATNEGFLEFLSKSGVTASLVAASTPQSFYHEVRKFTASVSSSF